MDTSRIESLSESEKRLIQRRSEVSGRLLKSKEEIESKLRGISEPQAKRVFSKEMVNGVKNFAIGELMEIEFVHPVFQKFKILKVHDSSTSPAYCKLEFQMIEKGKLIVGQTEVYIATPFVV